MLSANKRKHAGLDVSAVMREQLRLTQKRTRAHDLLSVGDNEKSKHKASHRYMHRTVDVWYRPCQQREKPFLVLDLLSSKTPDRGTRPRHTTGARNYRLADTPHMLTAAGLHGLACACEAPST